MSIFHLFLECNALLCVFLVSSEINQLFIWRLLHSDLFPLTSFNVVWYKLEQSQANLNRNSHNDDNNNGVRYISAGDVVMRQLQEYKSLQRAYTVSTEHCVWGDSMNNVLSWNLREVNDARLQHLNSCLKQLKLFWKINSDFCYKMPLMKWCVHC